MTYNHENKLIVIPDKEIENLMDKLEISKEEAIETWLMDNDLLEDEEADEMTAKAKANKTGADAAKGHRKTNTKPKTVKISDEKKELFSMFWDFLQEKFAENAQIVKENKEFSVTIGEKKFKIDLVEHRPPKKKP